MRQKKKEIEEEEGGVATRPSRRAIWSGSISFGLVTIPIRLFPAVREKDLHFHLLDRQEKVRLRRKLVRASDEEEVLPEEQVRGYEFAPDQYVIVTDEELESAEPEAVRAIEIEDFVALSDIDPVYYERTYYTAPAEGGAKAYRLLLEAMSKSNKVGIGRFVMRNKQYLTALRPIDGAIALETMHFPDEIVSTETLDLPQEVKVSDRELKIALQLIETMSAEFKPEKYQDTYRESVMKMIEAKIAGKEIVTPPAPPAHPGEIIDLAAELEKSLAARRAPTERKRKAS